MFRLLGTMLLGIVAVLCAATSADANSFLQIFSGSGSGTCVLGPSQPPGPCTITPNTHIAPEWQQPGVGLLAGSPAVWVTFNNQNFPPSGASSAMIVTESFTVGGTGASINLRAWSDDTVFVSLTRDGTPIAFPLTVAPCLGGVCTPCPHVSGQIGCIPSEGGLFNSVLDPGNYSLTFDAYQLGGGPFGLIYSGLVSILQIREEIPLQAMTMAAGRAATRACGTREADSNSRNQVWVSARQGHINAGAQTGVEFTADYRCLAGGYNLPVTDTLQFGLSGWSGTTDIDASVVQGKTSLTGDGRALSATATLGGVGAFTAMASFGYAVTDWDGHLTTGSAVSSTVEGTTANVSAQYVVPLGEPANLLLTAGVDYDGTRCSQACLINGMNQKISGWSSSAAARLNMSLYDGALQPYATLVWSDTFGAGQTATYKSVSVTSDVASSMLMASGGFTAPVADNIGLFLEGAYQESLDNDITGYQAAAGAKVSW